MIKRRNTILLLSFSLIITSIVVAISVALTEQQPILAQVKQTLSPNNSSNPILQEFLVPAGSRPHDVAPAPDGTVWYTAQGSGELGRLDPKTGKTHSIALG